MPGPDSATPTGAGAVGPAILDHVAVAGRWPDAWPRYAVELGGAWKSGGLDVGFGPAQLRFANGARIEILQPWRPEADPFLRRFLDANGPGPHHLTFKVADLAGALETVSRAGFDPVGVNLSDPMWKEAFLHPRQATGIVVQLAQSAEEFTSPAPEGFPTALHRPPASLDHVAHAVADLDAALVLFRDLLGGTVRAEGSGLGHAHDASLRWVELAWSGPLALRLLGPAAPVGAAGTTDGGPLASHLAGWPGRVHHLHFSVDDPVDISHSVAVDGVGDGGSGSSVAFAAGPAPAWVVEPAHNLGTRLVLRAR